MGRRKAAQGVVAAAIAGLAILPGALAGVSGPTVLVSKGNSSAPVTERGFGAVSDTGQFVVFDSAGRDLDPDDDNVYADVFIKDLTAADPPSRLTSAHSDPDSDTNGSSTVDPGAISSDGNKVVFTSVADNLVDHDVNKVSDVFVHDRSAGTTDIASLGNAGLELDKKSYDPQISGNGRYVVFTSDDTKLSVPDLNGVGDVFVRDLQSGTTELVSANQAGLVGNGASGPAAISDDGRKVAFISSAKDLVAGDTNAKPDVFVRDLDTNTTTRVSVTPSGAQHNRDVFDPFISGNGRYVGFVSTANNMPGVHYTAFGYSMYVKDLAPGGRLERVITSQGLESRSSNHAFRYGSISDDGRLVSFATSAPDLVPGDTNGPDVFVWDRATDSIEKVSGAMGGGLGNGQSLQNQIAGNGSQVAFHSNSNNLVAGMADSFNNQVFARPFSADSVTADSDGDGVPNTDDTCPNVADPAQTDTDEDGRGNACDMDDDSDVLTDDQDAAQNTDPSDSDSDNDGANDWFDDYPNDAARKTGTEHNTVNVAYLNSDHGETVAKLVYEPQSKSFIVRVSGGLTKNVLYTVDVYRTAPGIRQTRACQGRADANGVLVCGTQPKLPYFTHVTLSSSAGHLSTAVCSQSAVGERRCEVPPSS